VWWGKLVPSAFIGAISKHLVGRSERVRCAIRPISDVIREHAVERIDLLKLDIEGGELDALLGIDDEHWPLIRQVVAEVHDEDGRLARVGDLLRARGFSHLVIEQEPAFDKTWLHNVFARR
jgi:nonribosomal peptide synthetase DhbF